MERGATPSIAREDDKSTIVALREIADETISLEGLRELAKKATHDDSDSFPKSEENSIQTVEEMMLSASADESDEDAFDDEPLDEEDLKALNDLDEVLNENEGEPEDEETDEGVPQ